jgi:NRAMP (natural resistance-associated macrophage protein)-like metal ion transporter
MSSHRPPSASPEDDVTSGRANRSPGEGAQDAVATKQKLPLSGFLSALGPGIISGSADNDPAGITTYSVIGAQSGYSQNWLLLISTPLLIVVQQMSARVGNVTKTDFATAIRSNYGKTIGTSVVLAVVIANVLTLGADLDMLAAVTGLVTGVKFIYFVVPFAVVMAYVAIFVDYRAFARSLLWLGAVFCVYIVAALLARPNWEDVLRQTFIPTINLSPAYFLSAVGLLGTTITPSLFFWQTSGEIEERRGVQSIPRTNIDIVGGMVWSNVIAFFVLVTTGTVLFSNNANVKTAADAAKALEPIAGPYATYLFAAGILSAGLLGIPVLAASTAYSVAGLAGWRRSLSRTARNAPEFYLVLGGAFLVGVQFAIVDLDPIKLMFYSQVLSGLIAPFLIVLLVRLTSNRKIMGDFVNSPAVACVGWVTVLVLLVADGAMVYSVAANGLPN